MKFVLESGGETVRSVIQGSPDDMTALLANHQLTHGDHFLDFAVADLRMRRCRENDGLIEYLEFYTKEVVWLDTEPAKLWAEILALAGNTYKMGWELLHITERGTRTYNRNGPGERLLSIPPIKITIDADVARLPDIRVKAL